jgi:methylglutaconyl-CoA hydratase
MAKTYTCIRYETDGPVTRLFLNRPEVRNAFDDVMIGELALFFKELAAGSHTRALVVTGTGDCFCAGADLSWMKRMKEFTVEQNLEDASQLAGMLRQLYTLPVATIASVNGHAIGGGLGLIAACDFAVASQDARFAFSEVKLGLTPATISTYVIRKIGERACRELFITGRRIPAERALGFGLLNSVVPGEKLEEAVQMIVDEVLTSGPAAVTACKELLRDLPTLSLDDAQEYTSRMIAELRVSQEAQEAMAAFLEKRRPGWAPAKKE